MEYSISQIFIYPIKGLGGIALQEAELSSTGLKHDRRWMLIDENGRFLSQREFPELCLFHLSFGETGFIIRYQTEEQSIPFEITTGSAISVHIWDDFVEAFLAPNKISTWFSKHLNQEVRLVYMPNKTTRLVDTKYAHQNETVSFADAFPVLIIGESSLQLLQSKLNETITINRFRPNIVFSGGPAHIEDTWHHIRINNLPFTVAKPCARCTVITIDPATGKKGPEPLKTLAQYRTQNNKILFGQNMLAPKQGVINVGMSIKTL